MPRKIESIEDYLERILILQDKIGVVRSIDIANDMSYSKPSVSIAMKKLRQYGYIDVDENGYILLTPSGKEIAENVLERHTLVKKALMAIGVDEETAAEDACKIEHDLSNNTYECLKKYFNK